MKLSRLLAGDGRWPLPLHVAGDGGDPEITGVTADSREVCPGYLFAALPGTAVDGAKFVPEAIAKGAVAVLVSDIAPVPEGRGAAYVIRSGNPRRDLGRLAANFYGRQPAHVAAITGTSGKTSVADFTRQILAAAGTPAASIGTIGVVRPDGSVYGGLTTPDPVSLHRTLADLADEGVSHLVFEASSHGLDQHRLDGVAMEVAAFTNLGRDHLDYHPSVSHYLDAKLRLFRDLLPEGGTAVINADGAFADKAEAVARTRGQRCVTVGRNGETLQLIGVVRDGFAQRLSVRADGREFSVRLPLIGDYQVENALVAAGIAQVYLGIPQSLTALESLKGVSGRLEIVGEGNGGLVVVDYAHKPEALAAALAGVRPFVSGRLICVFGCGGDRDQGKRPLMGAIAAEGADIVIVTDDNPRSEDPAAIRQAILAQCPGAYEAGDRREAIVGAIQAIGPGDVVLIAGKGHETGQIIGDRVLPFSDQEVAREALAMLEAEAARQEAAPQPPPQPLESVVSAVLSAMAQPAAPAGTVEQVEAVEIEEVEEVEEGVREPAPVEALRSVEVVEAAEAAITIPPDPVDGSRPLWRYDELLEAAAGRADGQPGSHVFGVSIDSRSIAAGDLFVALKAERDGHDFVSAAFAAGAAAALVSQDYARQPGDGALIRVEDTLSGLERIGAAARARLGADAKVVAVTGSVGKTTTKEMLRACLSRLGRTHAAYKSFNNHWGVPLTLARMPADTQFGVFEIGMNHAGEITPLSRLVRPHAVIITTVAPVHLEHFNSVEEIAAAKAEILAGLEPGGTAVLNRDNEHFGFLKTEAGEAGAAIADFGASPFARVALWEIEETASGSRVTARLSPERADVSYEVSVPGRHMVLNSLAVLAALRAIGADLDHALCALAAMTAAPGRGVRADLPMPGGGSALLIDESYNANPVSMRAAIAVLGGVPRDSHPRRLAVIGDMLELGEQAEKMHAQLAGPLRDAGVDRVYCVGPLAAALFDALDPAMRGGAAATPDGLQAAILSEVKAGDVIMIKGSNGARTWQLAEALRRQFPG